MKRLLLAAALSTSCLATSACAPTRIAEALPTPPDRLVCDDVQRDASGKPVRPKVPPDYVIDWSKVTTVPQARAEHD
jgi:hypothetical protein